MFRSIRDICLHIKEWSIGLKVVRLRSGTFDFVRTAVARMDAVRTFTTFPACTRYLSAPFASSTRSSKFHGMAMADGPHCMSMAVFIPLSKAALRAVQRSARCGMRRLVVQRHIVCAFNIERKQGTAGNVSPKH
eukprot:6180353-Pleurochrysis_carterae.AAC.2